jgi:hypothetical protein
MSASVNFFKVNLNLSTDLSLQRFSIAFTNIALIFAMASPYHFQFAFLFPIINLVKF